MAIPHTCLRKNNSIKIRSSKANNEQFDNIEFGDSPRLLRNITNYNENFISLRTKTGKAAEEISSWHIHVSSEYSTQFTSLLSRRHVIQNAYMLSNLTGFYVLLHQQACLNTFSYHQYLRPIIEDHKNPKRGEKISDDEYQL